MKKGILVYWISLAVIWAGGTRSARAQNFAIDWFTISGGGGTSTAGLYSVGATIDQSETGMQSGSIYSLSGGFWSILQEPAPPMLRIVRSGPEVLISWLAASTGFELQESADLNPTSWSPLGTAPTTVGTEQQVVVTATVGHRFFRLRKP